MLIVGLLIMACWGSVCSAVSCTTSSAYLTLDTVPRLIDSYPAYLLYSPSIIMAKFCSLLASIALLSIGQVVPSNAKECPVVEIDSKVPLKLALDSENSNCFQVGDSFSLDPVRLTILNGEPYGRYEISSGFTGYAWSKDAYGIYYCAKVGDTIVFKNFPREGRPIVSIYAELHIPKDSTCSSDVIGYYYSDLPIPTPTNGDTTGVFWSHHKYFLITKHFEYQVKGEDVVSMKNAKEIDIDGDPGDEEYSTIEVEWEDENGVERRFNGYMKGSVSTWQMFEVGVYNNEGDWVMVYPNSVESLSGAKGTCFKTDSLSLTNTEGDIVKFEGLSLATFMPWDDKEEFLKCINAFEIEISFSENIDLRRARDAVAATLGVSSFQVQMMRPVSSTTSSMRSLIVGEGKIYRARIANADKVQAEDVYCIATAEGSISVLSSSVEPDCSNLSSGSVSSRAQISMSSI